ncbi:MAG: hypothetical protein ACPG49_07940 [Chitinophagales bacterium]
MSEGESLFEAKAGIPPNPVQGLIEVEDVESFDFQLFNEFRKILQLGRIESHFFQLDLGKLTQEFYLFKAGSRVYRIVKN